MSLRHLYRDLHSLGIYPDLIPNLVNVTIPLSLGSYVRETKYKYPPCLLSKCTIKKRTSKYFSIYRQAKYIFMVDGRVVTKEYLKSGYHHRIGKPAVRTFHPNGKPLYIYYVTDGFIKKVTKYDENGKICYDHDI